MRSGLGCVQVKFFGMSMKATLGILAVGLVLGVVLLIMKGASPVVALALSPIIAILFLAGILRHKRLDHFRKHGKDIQFLEYEDRDDV